MSNDETEIKKVEIPKLVKQDSKPDPKKILKPTKGDAAHSVIKASLSSIPIVGGAVSEIFSFGVESPLQKRQDEFIISIDSRVTKLEEKNLLSSQFLKDNDEFIDIATHALQIAIRNSSREKITALQNAVINTALQTNIDSDSKFMYLNFIDELSQIQIQLIKIFMEPSNYIEQMFQNGTKNPQGSIVIDVLKDLQKALNIDKVLYDVSIKRLETDGLIDLTDRAPGPPIGGYDENSWFIGKPELEERTKNLVTPFGKMFVKFISESELEHGNKKHV